MHTDDTWFCASNSLLEQFLSPFRGDLQPTPHIWHSPVRNNVHQTNWKFQFICLLPLCCLGSFISALIGFQCLFSTWPWRWPSAWLWVLCTLLQCFQWKTKSLLTRTQILKGLQDWTRNSAKMVWPHWSGLVWSDLAFCRLTVQFFSSLIDSPGCQDSSLVVFRFFGKI